MQLVKVRFIIAAIVTFSAYAVYLSRINLSIALIAMVDDNHTNQTSSTVRLEANSSKSFVVTKVTVPDERLNGTSDPVSLNPSSMELIPSDITTDRFNLDLVNQSSLMSHTQINSVSTTANNNNNNNNNNQDHQQEPIAPIFPLKGKNSLLIMTREKFDWNQKQQGQILGAFFIGYILIQIPGARMAESVGAYWIIMAATFGSALISLAFPLTTQLNSIYLLMLLRFVMGLCQSAFFPAAYVLFCRWLPEGERAILLPVMFIGSNMGSISTYIMSSYLISSQYGWPSVFYVSGLICLIVSGAWCIVGSSGPEDNWIITDEECRFILHNVNNQSSENNSIDIKYDCDHDKRASIMEDACNHQNISKLEEKNEKSTNVHHSNVMMSKLKFQNNSQLMKPTSQSCNNISNQALTFQTLDDCCTTGVGQVNQSNTNTINTTTTTTTTITNNNNNKLSTNILKQDSISGSKFDDLQNSSPSSSEPCWSKLIKSIPVWTLILSMYGNEWSNVVLCYELPTYLNTALNYPIERNGVINSFFQFSYAVASPIMSSLGAHVLDSRTCGMHKIHVRKLFQSLATFGQAACFLAIAICGLNVELIILLMFASIIFRSCSNAGDIMVAGDLSPEYAGTIFAFANSVGNTAGFVVPMFAGFFISNARDHAQWTPFWLTTACIMATSGLIFLIFGETRRQDFSKSPQQIKRMDQVSKSKRRSSCTSDTERRRIRLNSGGICDQQQLESRC